MSLMMKYFVLKPKGTEARKVCPHCQRKFKTVAARRSHQTKMHRREETLALMKQQPATKWASEL